MDHVTLLCELVRIESVNPDLVPGAPGEENVARFVAERLREWGLEVEIEYAAPGRPNVIGTVRGRGVGPSLMLNAHMDTVGAGEMADPFNPRVEGSRLYGRGSYDMKGSLASVMLAARELAKDPPAGDVIVAAVCDEEYASIGTAAIVAGRRADAAIVTEPTALDVCVAHKGFVWFEIESRGVAAHGSRPDIGVDAIARMGRVLTGIEQLGETLRSGRAHPLLGTGSIHASIIAGGRELSTYPEQCRLAVERRTVPGERIEDAANQLREILRAAESTDPRSGFSLSTGLVRPPFEVAADEPVVSVLCSEIARRKGAAPRIYGETPWFDAALFAAAGIPCVIFGPGGGGAHAAVEWSDLDQVEQCSEILVEVARAFCRAR